MRFTRHEQHLARRGNSLLCTRCTVWTLLVSGMVHMAERPFLLPSFRGSHRIWEMIGRGRRKLYNQRNNIILRAITPSGLYVQANSQKVSQEIGSDTKQHSSRSRSGQDFLVFEFHLGYPVMQIPRSLFSLVPFLPISEGFPLHRIAHLLPIFFTTDRSLLIARSACFVVGKVP